MPGAARIAAIGRKNISVRRVAVVMPVTVQPIAMAVPNSVDGVDFTSTGKPLTASTGRAAIAWITLRQRRYLSAIRPHGEVMLLTTMVHADEVLPAESSLRCASKMARHAGFP